RRSRKHVEYGFLVGLLCRKVVIAGKRVGVDAPQMRVTRISQRPCRKRHFATDKRFISSIRVFGVSGRRRYADDIVRLRAAELRRSSKYAEGLRRPCTRSVSVDPDKSRVARIIGDECGGDRLFRIELEIRKAGKSCNKRRIGLVRKLSGQSI